MAGGQVETLTVPFRYVWPSELDLMARRAGMTLRERWSDWQRSPFTGENRSHVSVWQKAPQRRAFRALGASAGRPGGLPQAW
jgi:hypothetical protein